MEPSSKWFLQKIGHEGCNARFCAFLVSWYSQLCLPFLYFVSNSSFHYLGLNNLLMAYTDKSAYALCVFSLALGPTMEPITFLGKTPVWLWFPIVLFSQKRMKAAPPEMTLTG